MWSNCVGTESAGLAAVCYISALIDIFIQIKNRYFNNKKDKEKGDDWDNRYEDMEIDNLFMILRTLV